MEKETTMSEPVSSGREGERKRHSQRRSRDRRTNPTNRPQRSSRREDPSYDDAWFVSNALFESYYRAQACFGLFPAMHHTSDAALKHTWEVCMSSRDLHVLASTTIENESENDRCRSGNDRGGANGRSRSSDDEAEEGFSGVFGRFLRVLATHLPTSFRVNGTAYGASSVRDRIRDYYVPLLRGMSKEDGMGVPPLEPISWYPSEMGWQMDMWKRELRKSPELVEFREFLKVETARGNLSRQETVSMLPPFFLDVRPYHRVLDMCAAPGSKTAQLLEMLGDVQDPSDISCAGFVVANDVDTRRAYMLVHQVQRLRNLFPFIMVTNHDSRCFPSPRVQLSNGVVEKLRFDRILCDVVCSGDGTLRKSPNLWRSWHPGIACGLHKTQVDIAKRGIQLLSDDGILVYSTCSMNPIEDEAVVAELLRIFPDIELEDCSVRLPELLFSPGITEWFVPYRDKLFLSFEEMESAHPNQTRILPSMFHPTSTEASWMHLDRCMRILPHFQNSGGFFIAVFRKKACPSKSLSSSSSSSLTAHTSSSDVSDDVENLPEEKIVEWRGRSVITEQGQYFQPPTHVLEAVRAFYGITPDLLPDKAMVCRQAVVNDNPQKVYMVSPRLRPFLADGRLRVVNAGLKIFETRQLDNSGCIYRLTNDGIAILGGVSTLRKIRLSTVLLKRLLSTLTLSFTDLDPDALESIRDLENGGCIVIVPQVEDLVERHGAVIPRSIYMFSALKTRASLSLMVRKDDLRGYVGTIKELCPEFSDVHIEEKKESTSATDVDSENGVNEDRNELGDCPHHPDEE